MSYSFRRPTRGRPIHRSDGSWGTICGRQDYGKTPLQITRHAHDVTCKSCQKILKAAVKKYGEAVATYSW